jgi:phosphate-selective porin OprO/OprP
MSWPYRLRVLAILALFAVISATEAAEVIPNALAETTVLSPMLLYHRNDDDTDETTYEAPKFETNADGTNQELQLSLVEAATWLNEEVPQPPATTQATTQDAQLAERLQALESKYSDLQESHTALQENFESYSLGDTSGSSMTVFGRINVDMWQYPHTTPGVNGFETGNVDIPPQDRIGFRRLRLGVLGELSETMIYKFEAEFAGGNNAEFRDAYFGFTDLPVFQTLLIGNQKRPYGLDHWNSSRYNVFMERPYIVEAFNGDSRRLGVQSLSYSEDLAYNWQYGLFNQADIMDTGSYTSDHLQGQVVGRFANTCWYDECSDGRGYAHWALSGTWADTNGNANTENYADSGVNQAQFRTRPEAWTINRWLNTGLIDGSKDYTLLGVENVVNLGPLQIVGEYMNVWLNRDADTQLHFQGGYAYISYFLTGEHMPWNREMGQLNRPKPFENFFLVDTCRDGVQGGSGAWQIAVRGSYGDLSDDNIQGGIGESVTFGLNWYWTQRSRMQFNCIYGNIHDNALNAVDGITYGDYVILGTRFMTDF